MKTEIQNTELYQSFKKALGINDKKDNETPKTDAKNKKFKIKEGFGSLRIDGKLYQEGDEVEISEKRAKEI